MKIARKRGQPPTAGSFQPDFTGDWTQSGVKMKQKHEKWFACMARDYFQYILAKLNVFLSDAKIGEELASRWGVKWVLAAPVISIIINANNLHS